MAVFDIGEYMCAIDTNTYMNNVCHGAFSGQWSTFEALLFASGVYTVSAVTRWGINKIKLYNASAHDEVPKPPLRGEYNYTKCKVIREITSNGLCISKVCTEEGTVLGVLDTETMYPRNSVVVGSEEADALPKVPEMSIGSSKQFHVSKVPDFIVEFVFYAEDNLTRQHVGYGIRIKYGIITPLHVYEQATHITTSKYDGLLPLPDLENARVNVFQGRRGPLDVVLYDPVEDIYAKMGVKVAHVTTASYGSSITITGLVPTPETVKYVMATGCVQGALGRGLYSHSATTYGGFSGAALMVPKTKNHVIGMHLGGDYQKRHNYFAYLMPFMRLIESHRGGKVLQKESTPVVSDIEGYIDSEEEDEFFMRLGDYYMYNNLNGLSTHIRGGWADQVDYAERHGQDFHGLDGDLDRDDPADAGYRIDESTATLARARALNESIRLRRGAIETNDYNTLAKSFHNTVTKTSFVPSLSGLSRRVQVCSLVSPEVDNNYVSSAPSDPHSEFENRHLQVPDSVTLNVANDIEDKMKLINLEAALAVLTTYKFVSDAALEAYSLLAKDAMRRGITSKALPSADVAITAWKLIYVVVLCKIDGLLEYGIKFLGLHDREGCETQLCARDTSLFVHNGDYKSAYRLCYRRLRVLAAMIQAKQAIAPSEQDIENCQDPLHSSKLSKLKELLEEGLEDDELVLLEAMFGYYMINALHKDMARRNPEDDISQITQLRDHAKNMYMTLLHEGFCPARRSVTFDDNAPTVRVIDNGTPIVRVGDADISDVPVSQRRKVKPRLPMQESIVPESAELTRPNDPAPCDGGGLQAFEQDFRSGRVAAMVYEITPNRPSA
jgi:hypothetical protein